MAIVEIELDSYLRPDNPRYKKFTWQCFLDSDLNPVELEPTVYVKKHKISYIQRVIDTFFKTERFMSDVYGTVTYARVWDDETEKPKHIRLYDNFDLRSQKVKVFYEVDATTEVLKKFKRYVEKQNFIAKKEEARILVRQREEYRQTPTKGKTVQIIKGRKFPIGTTGIVFYVCDLDRYGVRKCGILTDKGDKIYVNSNNLKVIDYNIKQVPISKEDTQEFEFEKLKESHKALLVKIQNKEFWVPKSKTEINNSKIILPNWLVKNKLGEQNGI